MQKDERTDRDELTARLRKFGISDALCDRVRAEGVEAVLKAPKGTKKKDPSKGATAKSDASLFTPPNLPKSKHRKSALAAPNPEFQVLNSSSISDWVAFARLMPLL